MINLGPNPSFTSKQKYDFRQVPNFSEPQFPHLYMGITLPLSQGYFKD